MEKSCHDWNTRVFDEMVAAREFEKNGRMPSRGVRLKKKGIKAFFKGVREVVGKRLDIEKDEEPGYSGWYFSIEDEDDTWIWLGFCRGQRGQDRR